MHPDLRASDADRHAVAEHLAGHAAAGRLTLDEFDSRVRSAWTAQTYADLYRLLADLPAPASATRVPATPGPATHAPRLELVAIVLAVLLVLLGLAAPAMAGGCM
jgi:hypothetical protein